MLQGLRDFLAKISKFHLVCVVCFLAIVYLSITMVSRASPIPMNRETNKNLNGSFASIKLNNVSVSSLLKNYKTPHYMSLLNPQGRTGNNLFHYAMLISTARRYGYTPVLSQGFQLTEFFEIAEVKNVKISNVKVFGERGPGIYNESVEHLDVNYNWTFRGDFQSWRYHDDAILQSAIKFKPDILSTAEGFMGALKVKGRPDVCIHVRRGDLTEPRYDRSGFSMADAGYINNAMEYFRSKFHGNVLFIVLSDGMTWCKTYVKGNDVRYSKFTNPGHDLALMSLCDHVIMTSGTFGWWGGRLCKGEVVYWRGYPKPGSSLQKRLNATDFYPPSWTGLW